VSELQAHLGLLLSLVLLGVKVFALVDCVARNPRTLEAASQVSKNGWLVILGLSVLAHVVTWDNPLRLLNLAGTLAAFVYLAQARGSQHSY
jgi:hypothetical protein